MVPTTALSDKEDWRACPFKLCVTKHLRKECGDLNENASDNDEDKDDDTNIKGVEAVEIGTVEALTMLDRLAKLKDLSKEE